MSKGINVINIKNLYKTEVLLKLYIAILEAKKIKYLDIDLPTHDEIQDYIEAFTSQDDVVVIENIRHLHIGVKFFNKEVQNYLEDQNGNLVKGDGTVMVPMLEVSDFDKEYREYNLKAYDVLSGLIRVRNVDS